jgi:fumarate hydratase class II
MAGLLGKNPILVTSLNPVIGLRKGRQDRQQAYKEGRSLKEVALEQTDLKPEELDRLLDPRKMTEGGIMK